MDCFFYCQPLINRNGLCPGVCFNKCPDVCRVLRVDDRSPESPHCPPPPPLLPGAFPPYVVGKADKLKPKHLLFTHMSIGVSLLGTALFLGILCLVVRSYYRRQGNRRRAGSAPVNLGTQEDFSDENQEPELDHPIWYIRTVGLQQSVIDAIAVFKYKKGEGLVEGTDCSVCLNEFQDDETLRLLPKCSHAFHLPCIDTWLRSHKNCPLCRAPIASANYVVQVDLSEPASSDLNPREAQIGNFGASSSGSVSSRGGQVGTSELRIGDGNISASEDETNGESGSSKLNPGHSNLNNPVRIRSELAEHSEDVETEIQPMRRSVSLDSSSALAIYSAVSQAVLGKQPGNLDGSKQPKHSRVKHSGKRGTTGSLSFRKLMKSSSIGKSLQTVPVSMKRSSSSSSKSSLLPSLSGESTRQDSVLPL